MSGTARFEPNGWIITPDSFVSEPINADFILCVICGQVIKNPVCLFDIRGKYEPICEHIFCRDCVSGLQYKNCPACRRTYNQIVSFPTLEKIIENQRMRCVHKDCEATFLVKDMQKHQSVCMYEMVNCGLCPKQCLRSEMKQHQQVCEFRTVKCDKCDVESPFCKLKSHIDDICPLTRIDCGNVGCKSRPERRHKSSHDLLCDYKIIDCGLGCGIKIVRGDIDKHGLICPNRMISCEHCQEIIQERLSSQHKEICPEIVISCDCGNKMARRLMVYHKASCEKTLIPCPYFEMGCQEIFERKSLYYHMSNEKKTHSELHFEHVKKMYKIGTRYDFLDETGKWQMVSIKEIAENCVVVERKVHPDKKREMALGYAEINSRLKSYGSMCLQKDRKVEYYNFNAKEWEVGMIIERTDTHMIIRTPKILDDYVKIDLIAGRIDNLGSNTKN